MSELEQRPLRLLHALARSARTRPGSRSPSRVLRRRARGARRAEGSTPRPAWREVDAQRAAVRRQLLDVDERRDRRPRRSTGSSAARSTRSARGRSCRTRGARSGARGAGTRRSPSRPARAAVFTPATKSFTSGTWASTLLPSTSSRPPALGDEPLGERCAEELGQRRHAPRDRRLGDVLRPGRCRAPGCPSAGSAGAGSRRSTPSRRRGRRRPRREPVGDHVDVAARVLDPRVRVGGEVGVLGEDLLGRRRTRGSARASRTCRPGRGAGRTAPSPRARSGGTNDLAERRDAEVDHGELERRCAVAADARDPATVVEPAPISVHGTHRGDARRSRDDGWQDLRSPLRV